METYAIKDWESIYETSETRKRRELRWVPIPNKHEGLGFRKVMRERDGAALLGTWLLLIQIASKGAPNERGTLTRDGKALSPEDMALITGASAESFKRALKFFSDTVDWLTITGISPVPADLASVACVAITPSIPTPKDTPVVPSNDGYEEPLTASAAQAADAPEAPCLNRKEEKEKKELSYESSKEKPRVQDEQELLPLEHPPRGKSTKRRANSLAEVVAFCQDPTVALPEADAQWFWHKCEGSGWTNGGRPIRDWKATLRSWRAARYVPSLKTTAQGHSPPAEGKAHEDMTTEERLAVERKEARRKWDDERIAKGGF